MNKICLFLLVVGNAFAGIPSSGTYWMDTAPGSVASRALMYYERIEDGDYRITAASGNGRGPNRFANSSSVVSEREMYGILVTAGAVDESCGRHLAASSPKRSSTPSSGQYRAPAPQGSLTHWNDFHYEQLPSGDYRIRSVSGSGHGPNKFAKGSVVSAEEMDRILKSNRR